jgi:hypothetical protein
MRRSFLAPLLVFIGVILLFAGAGFSSGKVLINPDPLEWIMHAMPDFMMLHGLIFIILGFVVQGRAKPRR